MKVILLEKMRNLGDLGSEVSVKKGYGRNFLIPQGKAISATTRNLAEFQARRAELEEKAKERLSVIDQKIEALKALGTITLKARTGDEGRLFGSIGTAEIARAIVAAGIEVKRQEIRLNDNTIRQIGEYDIELMLQNEFSTLIKLVVTSE